MTGQFLAFIPVTLNAGLMKPRKGFTPGAGEKAGDGNEGFLLDN